MASVEVSHGDCNDESSSTFSSENEGEDDGDGHTPTETGQADSEAESGGDEADSGGDEQTQSETRSSGLADVLKKLLKKSAGKRKNPVLSKGKTDKEIKRQKLTKTEAGGERKGGGETEGADHSSDDDSKTRGLDFQKKKEWEEMGRVKPNVLERETERMLQRIATRGVVQLFNAVQQQQLIVGDKLQEAGSSVRRRDKAISTISKKSFLDLLDTKSAQTKKNKQEKAEHTWSILRDDYMMGARMKDFDRNSDQASDAAHSDADS